jgi:choline kinase
MNQPFLLINGDTVFEAALLGRLLNSKPVYPITLATDRKTQYDDDDMKIIAEGDRLLRVGKKLEREQVNGESIGMMVFTQAGADAFVAKVEQLMGGADGLARWYLSAIDELARAGQVGICSIHGWAGAKWMIPTTCGTQEGSRPMAARQPTPTRRPAERRPPGS